MVVRMLATVVTPGSRPLRPPLSSRPPAAAGDSLGPVRCAAIRPEAVG